MDSKDWARLFVHLYDTGAPPSDYQRELGLSFDELCLESKRIWEYRNLIGIDIADYQPATSEDVQFAKSFVYFVDKGAGLRAYAKIGIRSKDDLSKYMANLSKYREIAAGKYVPQSLVFHVHSPEFQYIAGKESQNQDKMASIVVIGTTLPNRLDNLNKVLTNIDAALTSVFGDKILSLDDFGEGVPASLVTYALSNNWVIIAAKRRGMVKNQRDALSLVKTPWVLYSEDDATVDKLPTLQDMQKINELEHCGRHVGILSFMAGGYNIEAHRERIDWEVRKQESFVPINNEDVLWIRNDSFRNNWFVEFPISMMRTELMKQCSDYISGRALTLQIEHGFTVAWFELGISRGYFKTTYMRNPEHIKPLLEYSHKDISSTYIGRPLIHMRLLNSSTIHGGHNWGEKFNDH